METPMNSKLNKKHSSIITKTNIKGVIIVLILLIFILMKRAIIINMKVNIINLET
jgi:hypothetical protein